MSEADNFLTRWSRRKQEAADAKEAGPRDLKPADATEATGDTKMRSATESAKPSELPFDPNSLPPIESITAATDIRAFLAPGVPVELARAALRRAWAADPKIRDFVGLADYAWDFHAEGAMPGFGRLEMTEELQRAVAQIIGETTEGDGSSQTRNMAQEKGQKHENAQADAGQDLPDRDSEEINPVEPPPKSIGGRNVEGLRKPSVKNRKESERSAPPVQNHNAGQHESSCDDLTSAFRRRHGRALPK